ncbi:MULTISPECIES: hypothetical protein [Halorussus]|uniref:hypothetical protein n=1 Tax=Halorussus TaxID=1070314 RepID=UPI000E20CE64|nr:MULTISPECIES: hypothetical protein [Halorussus]NHN58168.1 hypothetical protein [Halorussus sp. JP-T4]
MTDDDNADSEGTPTDSEDAVATDSGDATDDDDRSTDGEGRPESFDDAVVELTERVDQLERTVAWMARQQAAETGNSACPECNTGGSLRVSRTPAGKKRVECVSCGETLN